MTPLTPVPTNIPNIIWEISQHKSRVSPLRGELSAKLTEGSLRLTPCGSPHSRLRRQLPSEREAKYRKSVCWSLVPTGYKEYARWIGGTQNTVEHILECGDVTAIGRVFGGTVFLACHLAPVKIPAGVMS